jgi:class 3 adenylate cyclase/glucose uptake protein GlcU
VPRAREPLRESGGKRVQEARGRVTRASDTAPKEYRGGLADRARRLEALDWVVLALLVPLAAAFVAAYTWHGIETGSERLLFRIAPAANAADYPVVSGVAAEALFGGPALAVGDRLVRAGDQDLRGAGLAEFWRACSRWFLAGGSFEVVRADARFSTVPVASPFRGWWALLPFSLGLLFGAVILMFRAPHWRLARRASVCSLAFCIWASGILPWFLFQSVPVGRTIILLRLIAGPLSNGLAISLFWEFTESAEPLARWQRALPWIFGVGLFIGIAIDSFAPLPLARVGRPVYLSLGVVALIAMLAGITRTYRRSDALERRQIRWVLYGLYVGLLPQIVSMLALSLGFSWATEEAVPVVVLLAFTAIPVGVFVSLFGYRLVDVDPLITATASYTILGVALLGVAVGGIPRVAAAAGDLVGVGPSASQWVLSLGFAAAAVQGHRKLRPWLDRRLFAERVAVEQGLGRLVDELVRCGSAEELMRLVGGRIDALLRPESVVTYARNETAFTPVFVRAHAAPAAFAADGVLVRALESRMAPLAVSDPELGPFDHAALATLGAEVVIPTRRGDALVAFTCLGRKRTGDIYTPAELALLGASSSASAEVLARMDDAEVLRQARAMQESLRRYVPGVIAEQLASGRALDAHEREVTVLFVDLRGFSSFAERRAAEDVFSTVNEHTERVSRLVRAHGGAVVEFNGDGMMAVFGAPEPLDHKERRAVEAAREIVDSSPADLSVGVGIASGLGFSGNIRAADRWIWSVIGDTTNLAARLQALTRELGVSIAIDGATKRAAGYVCADFALHREVQIRGRSQRIDVFALPLPPVLAASA